MEEQVPNSSSTAGKPIRCKAVVARKAGEPLVIAAPPKSHEVRIKIICTSLCHTDLAFWKLNVIVEMTDGGADYCFECVGLTSLVKEAYASSRRVSCGKTVILGVDKPRYSNVSFNSIDMLFSGKTVRGSLFGGLKTKSDMPTLVNWYLEKKMQLDEFVTHEMKIEDINEAMNLLIEGKCLRCVMWMD